MARGDHVYIHCLGYSHHGIDLGDGQLVHFDFHPWRALAQVRRGRKPSIRQVSMDEFRIGRDIITRKYDDCDDVEIVIERATSRLGESGYHLFRNNCEHFAVWCKTGEAMSTQVEDLLDATRPVGKIAPAATILMRSARRLPLQLRSLAYGTAFTMTAGAFAYRYLENRARRSLRQES